MSNVDKKKLFKMIGGISLAFASIIAIIGGTFAWQIAVSKATISGRSAIIRATTSMQLYLRYFTGNGTPGGTYEGYDSTTISGKTINYDDDAGNANDLYFAPLANDEAIAAALNFSAMRPGKNYSFAFQETGKDALSATLSAFAPTAQSSAPYIEMYTGPLAVCKDIKFNSNSWFRVHDTTLDGTGSSYNYMGYDRVRTGSSANFQNNSSTDGTRRKDSINCTASEATYDVVLFGDMTIGLYSSGSSYAKSTTLASSYKFYGYNAGTNSAANQFGSAVATPGEQSTSTFYYVNQATIDAWNTPGQHTKYITSASAVVGYSQGYAFSASASTNNSNASTYITNTTNGSLADKIDYRFNADIADGLASGNSTAVTGESAKTFSLGTTAGDNLTTSQVVYVTFSFSNDDSDKLKVICKRGDNSTEKIYYAYHPNGSLEPYFGMNAGTGSITLE